MALRGLTARLWLSGWWAGPKPSQSQHFGLAWPSLLGPGLAWLTASGQAKHTTNWSRRAGGGSNNDWANPVRNGGTDEEDGYMGLC
jgi:hypothetical protein